MTLTAALAEAKDELKEEIGAVRVQVAVLNVRSGIWGCRGGRRRDRRPARGPGETLTPVSRRQLIRRVVRRLGPAEWFGLATLVALLVTGAWLTHVTFGNRGVGGEIRRDVADVRADVAAAREDVGAVRRKVDELVATRAAARRSARARRKDLGEIRGRLDRVEVRLTEADRKAAAKQQ